MSIYATLWRLKFPKYGDDFPGGDWIEVIAQAVPRHVKGNLELVLSGEEYEHVSFGGLYERLCSALRGDRPRPVLWAIRPDGSTQVVFADGSVVTLQQRQNADGASTREQ